MRPTTLASALLAASFFLPAAHAAAPAASTAKAAAAAAPMPPGVWQPDQGDGTYINPILAGDYSDPDVVRVGDDFYLTASSFTNVPGLPVLHSKDLVNWTLIGHALARNVPDAHHAVPRHGGGVWAPAIRHHGGTFYIYYPDPDFGIFVVTATDPKGPWSAPELVDDTKGAIDPAPFWDDDGQAWLVHGFAGSRAGFKNVITLKKMSPDGRRTVGPEKRIIEGDRLPKVATSEGLMPWFTTEGPKLYKRKGWYYVFVPSGSVKGGWQGVFRSKHIEGPYEGRNVMDQGDTAINGPHQGAWVDTPAGEDWFVHFSDADSYGRRVYLQPMRWGADGWPVIGAQQGNAPYGAPVTRHRKPKVAASSAASVPVTDDEFDDGHHLGWQWMANPAADWVDSAVKGRLRLKAVSSPANLWESGQLLTQKLPGMSFSVTTALELKPGGQPGERAGLVVYGYDYAWIGLENTAAGLRLVQVTRLDADLAVNKGKVRQSSETVLAAPVEVKGPVHVRMALTPVVVPDPAPDMNATPAPPPYWHSMLRSTHAKVTFSYSVDGVTFRPLGTTFTTQPGRWVGTQVGLFAQAPGGTPSNTATRAGYAEFDYFRFGR